jgi:cellulose synthase/poly-beta-1,6-N-acetylglucosamine synthase-like glycosyltransferase
MAPPLEPRPWLRQAIAVVALCAGVVYLVWRWGFTLSVDTLWLGLPLVLAETWALVTLGLFIFEGWRRTSRVAPVYRPGARTAILVPTFNESEDVLRPTVLGARAVRAIPAPEVWVLDDGGRSWVAEMCEELGVHYVSRPAPRSHAKAGNLNHALEVVDADLLLVVDADHVPLPHALERTVGYFDDPAVAFVQTPQVFFNRGFQHPRATGDPLLNEQSMFYDVLCPGKDRNNAAFWCGSSAVIRREALVSIGGVATATVVEDAHTGMLLHARGWSSVYHDEVLAVGLAPEDVNAFLIQRGRWARGCFQVLRRCNPLRTRGLSFRQRIHYLSSFLHSTDGIQRLVTLAVPPAVLLTGTLPLNAPQLLFLCLFLPQLVLVPLGSHAIARGRYRFVASERFGIVRAVTYAKAAKALLSNKPIAFAVTPKGVGNARPTVLLAPLAFAVAAIAGVAVQALAQIWHLPIELPDFAFAVTTFWAILSTGLITSALVSAARIRHRRSSHRFPVSLDVRYALSSQALPVVSAQAHDLNTFGVALSTPEPLERNTSITVHLRLDGEFLIVRGTVVRGSPESGTYGVAFDPLPAKTRDAIARWCFRHPFGPELDLYRSGRGEAGEAKQAAQDARATAA